jgi:hypothetical protein
MKKSLLVLVIVTTCALGLSAGVQTASGNNGATVTRATVQSFFVDEPLLRECAALKRFLQRRTLERGLANCG